MFGLHGRFLAHKCSILETFCATIILFFGDRNNLLTHYYDICRSISATLTFLLNNVIGFVNVKTNINKALQAIQSPRTVPFFLLVSLLDGYSFPNVLLKGIVAFKH